MFYLNNLVVPHCGGLKQKKYSTRKRLPKQPNSKTRSEALRLHINNLLLGFYACSYIVPLLVCCYYSVVSLKQVLQRYVC